MPATTTTTAAAANVAPARGNRRILFTRLRMLRQLSELCGKGLLNHARQS
jgi:hypothetical protein